MSSLASSSAWAAVVEADAPMHRCTDAVSSIPRAEFRASLSWALGDFTSHPAARHILAGAHPQTSSALLPELEPLLLVTHPLHKECRRLVLRLPKAELADFLEQLTAKVVEDSGSDDEAYRRLAELLRTADADDGPRRLSGAAVQSSDPDIKDVGEDFG